MRIIGITMTLVQLVYFALSLCTIFNYGSLINSDILSNVGDEYPIKCVATSATGVNPAYEVKAVNLKSTEYPEGFVMQGLFMIILGCHIPYLFFSGKESLLIIIDEVMRQSISLTLGKKIL